MCGIAGYIGQQPLSPSRITRTLNALQQRGPDGQGVATFTTGNAIGVLLHTRLAIIDLTERANQPMTRAGCTVVFNGEIYNYLELRQELQQHGVTFTTESDTEVLLQAYLLWGEDCVNHFEGMWAFALWNSHERRLLLSRDRFAEKPLYYIPTASGFFFASETRALRELYGESLPVNERHMLRYLVHGYKSLYKTAETFYRGVHEIPHATTLTVNEELNVTARQYWFPHYAPEQRSLADTVAATKEALLKSMQLRLRADVPLAFCLSGGVDSGALASIAAKELGHHVTAFSIVDPDERYNEIDNIMATVHDLRCEHTVITLRPNDISLDNLRQLVSYHDAPVATITYFIHSFLSAAISSQGYKVVISGTAADELFTGYFDHWLWHLIEMKDHPQFAEWRSAWEKHIKPLIRNPYLRDLDRYLKNPTERAHIYLHDDIFASYLTTDFTEAWQEEHFASSPLRNRMLNELFHEATPVILHEDDLNSMKYSIENRSPYLDTDLLNVALTTPPEHLMQDGYAKYPLRAATAGILNDTVRLDRRKRGFNASIHSIIDTTSHAGREALLSDSPIFDFVRKEKIEELIAQRPLPNSYSKFLFNFLNAKLFMEQVKQRASVATSV